MRLHKKLIRNAVGFIGWEISRKHDPGWLQKFSCYPSAGRILEIIGPSGVGKTTLFRSVATKLGETYFLPHHALRLRPLSYNHDPKLLELYRRLLLQISNRLYQDYRVNWPKFGPGEHHVGANFWDFSKVLTYSANVARTDILMRSGFPRGFALDEGIFQFFVDELLEVTISDLKRVCLGRHLVLFNARDPDTIAMQAMRRHESRWPNADFQKKITTLESRRESALKEMSLYKEIAERAHNCNVEVLSLFAEDDTSKNKQALIDFSERVSSMKV